MSSKPTGARSNLSPTLVILLSLSASPSRAEVACRDRFLWPFSNTSIWNTAIGSDAVYAPLNLYPIRDESANTIHAPPANFHIDQDWAIDSREKHGSHEIVNATWFDDAGAFPAPHCVDSNCCLLNTSVLTPKATVPLPNTLFTDCLPNNNAAAVLLPDNRTLLQMQPFYRPHTTTRTGVEDRDRPFMAWYHRGAPQDFPWELDILGGGALGAHGGSGLSALGGSLRLGELAKRNEHVPIRHALKLELWAHAWYFGGVPALQNATGGNGGRNQYLWPATGSDSGSQKSCVDHGLYCGTDRHLAPGALLAVPPSVAGDLNSSINTIVGRKVLQALTDYGGYVVDSTGSQAGGAALCAEPSVIDEVLREYDISLNISHPVVRGDRRGRSNSEYKSIDSKVIQQRKEEHRHSSSLTPSELLYEDLLAIFRSLHAVTNNGPGVIGGGGVQRQAPAPPICI